MLSRRAWMRTWRRCPERCHRESTAGSQRHRRGHAGGTGSSPRWPRLVQTTAPLLLPTLSCLLALFAFVVLGNAVGVVVVVALALPGVVGLVRRVPLAGFWTTGLIVAGLLVRLS